MNSKFKILFILILSVIATGCSNNVKRYKLDYGIKNELNADNFKPIELISVTMPVGDKNSVMCRLDSTIALPDKMTYSTYIEEALKKTLNIVNEGKTNYSKTHKLKVELTNITLSTLSPKWIIDANVTVDENNPIKLNTTTPHNFSYMAMLACSNASNAFDEAVENFIKQLFTHPEVAKQLK